MLIQRSITVPNEDEINGIGAYVGAGSQTSLNNFIKDVHTALIEVGLIEVNLPDSLDIENIPYKSIDNYAQGSDRSIDYIDIGHKYYAFSDDEQEEQPVFIKITYSVKNCSRTTTNAATKNIFYTCFKLDVYRDLNNLLSVIPQQVLGYILINTLSNTSVYIENYVVVDSDLLAVSYDGKNLYLNIFPQTIKCPLRYGTGGSFKNNKKSSYISFYLYRKNNVFKFMNFSNYREIAHNSSSSYNFPALQVNQLITNINNNSTVLSTTSTLHIPLIDIVSNINNNYENGLNPLAFKSIIYDKATNSIYPNYNLLCSYTSQVGATNVAYELDLDNNTKGKYISFSIEDNNVYMPNTKTDLLIRYE